MPLLIAIQIPADQRTILAIVGILGGDLDCVDVSVFSGICRPLNGGSELADAHDDAAEELKLRDVEVVELFVSFPNPRFGIKDSFFILMEESKCIGDFCQGVVAD